MAARARPALLLLVLAVAFLAVPAVGAASWVAEAPAVATDPPPEATIKIVAFRMVPDRLDIVTGTTVTWVNNEPIEYPAVGGSHELVADDGSWRSPAIAPGTRWSRRFDQPGAAKYHSSQHSTASGEISVTGDPIVDRPIEQEVAITEDNPDDPTTWGFRPPDLIIETGTTVIWRNNGKNVHTVSADDKSFDSGDIDPGATWKHTFESAGAFAYHCAPHPWMKAQVRIVAPGSDPPPPVPVEHADHDTPPVDRVASATPERVGRGPVRHEVAIVEPNPAKPSEWLFDPATLDVKISDTVVWRNTGSVEHTVTGAAFDSGVLKPGTTWERKFETTGVFSYHCTPHPWMKAVVRVTEQDAEALSPLKVPASGAGATTSAPPRRAAEATRTADGPVRHEALILEPNLQDAMKWTFDPATLEARVGDTVAWRNTGSLQHTVTADSGTFDSGMLDAGGTFEHTFDQPGVYAYHCTPHPWMKATVRVTDAAGGEPPVAPPAVSGEQAAGPLDPATLRGGIAILPSRFRPSMILPIALGLSGLIVALAWFLAGTPGHRRSDRSTIG